jgi:hypothetical protein
LVVSSISVSTISITCEPQSHDLSASLFVLFPVREDGSKKGILLLSWRSAFPINDRAPGWEAFIRLHRLKQCNLMCLYKKKERDRVSARCTRVARVPSQPARSIGFFRANFQTGFYLDPDQSRARAGRVPRLPAGSVQISKLCMKWPQGPLRSSSFKILPLLLNAKNIKI